MSLPGQGENMAHLLLPTLRMLQRPQIHMVDAGCSPINLMTMQLRPVILLIRIHNLPQSVSLSKTISPRRWAKLFVLTDLKIRVYMGSRLPYILPGCQDQYPISYVWLVG